METLIRQSAVALAVAALVAPPAFAAGTGSSSSATSSPLASSHTTSDAAASGATTSETTTSDTTQSADQGEVPDADMSGTASGATTSPETATSPATSTGSTMPPSTIAPTAATSASSMEIGTRYQVVDFRQGSAEISQTEREKLRTLVDNARSKGQISKLHVAAWSDRAFPKEEGAALGKRDRDLGKNRIDRLETYFEDTLAVGDVETHNMAERSSWIARNFNTSDAELKSLFSQRGSEAPVTNEEFQLIKQMGGPGKAVVVVQMRGSASGATSSDTSDDAMGASQANPGTSSGATTNGGAKSKKNSTDSSY